MRWSAEEYAQWQARQRVLPDHSSEKQWQAQVVALAKQHGWLCYHGYDSRKSEPGFPDIVCTNGHSIIYAELKTATGQVSEAQARWLALLARSGAETHIWRPADRPAVEARLAGDAWTRRLKAHGAVVLGEGAEDLPQED